MATVHDRKLSGLYAGLTPIERSRMIAKLAREGNLVEMSRLCGAIPNAVAGAAYQRALRTFGELNVSVGFGLSLLPASGKAAYFALSHLLSYVSARELLWEDLRTLWTLFPYPATESELNAVKAIQWSEL